MPLDDALNDKFDINESSTLTQRLKCIPNQSHKVKDLIPAPLFLLTKKQKKCKTCNKILVKQGKDPTMNSQSDVLTFLLRDIVPKITIYRFNLAKYQDGQPIEVQAKFLNQNDSDATIQLFPLSKEILGDEDSMKKVNSAPNLPKDQFILESSDILNDFQASMQP